MRLVARLALADALHDRRLFLCFALTVAAVVAPLLLLFGLKTGVIDQLVGRLRADPATLEIRLRGHAAFDAAWFERMRARPEVAFVAPLSRFLARDLFVGRPADPLRGRNAGFVASGPGDPSLGPAAALVGGEAVVLGDRLARQGNFQPGEEILLWAIRPASVAGERRVDLRLRVAAIAPPVAGERPTIFLDPALAAAFEDFLEGLAVPALGWQGEPAPETRPFAAFRLFARDIDDVAVLERDLVAEGNDVVTDAARIAWTRTLDRNLTALFAILAACAALGVAVALGASLWANVERKRAALSLLRLMGVEPGALRAFPLVQAAVVALAGSAIAAAAALLAAEAINRGFGGAYLEASELCAIRGRDVLVATAAVLVLALVAGLAALRPVLRIAPAEGMREV